MSCIPARIINILEREVIHYKTVSVFLNGVKFNVQENSSLGIESLSFMRQLFYPMPRGGGTTLGSSVGGGSSEVARPLARGGGSRVAGFAARLELRSPWASAVQLGRHGPPWRWPVQTEVCRVHTHRPRSLGAKWNIKRLAHRFSLIMRSDANTFDMSEQINLIKRTSVFSFQKV